jgi:hypothetical protein
VLAQCARRSRKSQRFQRLQAQAPDWEEGNARLCKRHDDRLELNPVGASRRARSRYSHAPTLMTETNSNSNIHPSGASDRNLLRVQQLAATHSLDR